MKFQVLIYMHIIEKRTAINARQLPIYLNYIIPSFAA